MTVGALSLLLAAFTTVGAGSHHPVVEASVHEAFASSSNRESYVVVVLKRDGLGASPNREAAIAERRNSLLSDLTEENFRPVYRWTHVAGMTGIATVRGLEILSQHPLVERIGRDLQGSGQLGTSVPFIGATQAHAAGVTGAGVTVAVIDSGIDSNHPDLSRDIAAGGMHFLMQGADVGVTFEDEIGHGTSVAATITSDGVVASSGVAPDAKVLPIKVVAASGASFLSDWVSAVDYVVTAAPSQTRLAAINMSLASSLSFSESPCDSTAAINILLGDAIRAARDIEILTFASSGNRGQCNAMGSPACLSAAIAVAAVYTTDGGREPIVGTYDNFFGTTFGACADTTTESNQVACFSNRSGSNEFAAPGRSIVSSTLGGGTSQWTGTSQAAPHVAGALALLLSGTDGDPESCLAAMKLTGVQTIDNCGSARAPIRVDVEAALAAPKPFDEYCFGNGGDQLDCTDCPCGNNAPLGSRGGCMNSNGTSARLRMSGLPRVSEDTLRLTARALPPSIASVLVSGSNRLPASPAHPCFSSESGIANIGDGLRCAGIGLRRHGLRFSDASGSVGRDNEGWGGDDAPLGGIVSQAGFVVGQTRHFQLFYRDSVHGDCNGALSTTQAVSTTFVP